MKEFMFIYISISMAMISMEEWDTGNHEDLTEVDNSQSGLHFEKVQKQAHELLIESQRLHLAAWITFNTKVHLPSPLPPAPPPHMQREAWLVCGLVCIREKK
jgi:hypothetical protein